MNRGRKDAGCLMLSWVLPLLQRIFGLSRAKWWQITAAPLIAVVAVMWITITHPYEGASEMMLTLLPVFAVVGFVAAIFLCVRDKGRERHEKYGLAALTPTKLMGRGLKTAPVFDEAEIPCAILRTVGPPPRPARGAWTMYRTPKRPPWLKRDDLISNIYDQYSRIVKRGEVRWAAVIHANSLMFAPGDVDCGAQVAYAVDGAPLGQARKWASACYAVKNTTPANPAVRRIADMLTDELERALDWPIPTSLCDGANAITTVVMLPRNLLPLGYLTCPFFPVFADPVTKMAVLVPSAWWPASLVNMWILAGQLPEANN
jgi:hypothetical protein